MGNEVSSPNMVDYGNRVVCKVILDNKTDFELRSPQYFIHNGQLGYGPVTVQPQSECSVVVGHQTLANASGTTGVVGWMIGNSDDMLVVLWCAPYNFDHYNNCYAIGFKKKDYIVDFESYHEMYYDDSSLSKHSWFRRKEVNRTQFDSLPLVVRKGRFEVESSMEEKHRCIMRVTMSDVPARDSKNSNNCSKFIVGWLKLLFEEVTIHTLTSSSRTSSSNSYISDYRMSRKHCHSYNRVASHTPSV